MADDVSGPGSGARDRGVRDIRARQFDADENDAVLQRVRATLAPMPPVDPLAVSRVLSAVHGRARPPQNRGAALLEWLRVSPMRLAGGSAVLVMALVTVVLIQRDPVRNGAGSAAPSVAVSSAPDTNAPGRAAGGASTSVTPAAANANAEGAVPVQFTLDLPTATSVAVVGDFNEWNATSSPMRQLPGSDVWTATLVISPGRHVYSFVVDGKTWIADPRAPRAADSDFGKPGSVLLVTPR
jgi:hypothetical protein